MDEQGMPSDAAQAARAKAKKVMEALNSGEPGAADEMLGKGEPKGNLFGSFKSKFGGKKDKKAEKKTGGDGVVR